MATSSLGTLTIDLIAKTKSFEQGMTKAERSSKKWKRQVVKDTKAIARSIVAVTSATAAAVSAAAVVYVNNAKELSKLSSIANTSVSDFQKMAVAAKTVGIENEKLSDILKDVNDRVGDFIQTGGGPMKDFFEQIAPKVGVTADAFRDLSGADALKLYVDTLEKAGVNQQDMTFYMEAIASDATALLPLLTNGAEGLGEWARMAEKAGIVMNDKTARAAIELGIQIEDLNMMGQGLTNQFMDGLIPSLNNTVLSIMDTSDASSAATEAGAIFGKGLAWLAKTAIGVQTVFVGLGKTIGAVAAMMAQLNIGENISLGLDKATLDAREAMPITKDINDFLANKLGIGETNAALKARVVQQEKEVVEISEKWAAIKDIGKSFSDDMGELLENNAQMIARIDETAGAANTTYAESVKKRADIQKAYQERMKNVSKTAGINTAETDKNTKKTKSNTAARKTAAAAAKAQRNALKKINDVYRAYGSLTQSLETAEERKLRTLAEQLDTIKQMQALRDKGVAGAASQGSIDETRNRVIGAAFGTDDMPKYEMASQAGGLSGAFGELSNIEEQREKLMAWRTEQLEGLRSFYEEKTNLAAEYAAKKAEIEEATQAQEIALQQATQITQLSAASQMFGEMAGMAKTYAGEQSGIYKAMFAAQKAFAIATAMINIQKAVSEAGTLPFPANIPAMATVAANMGTIVSSISSIAMPQGMAHDGIDSVPNTGTWLLEKGERVMTSKTSAKLDATLAKLQNNQSENKGGKVVVNLIEDKGKAGQTQTAQTNEGEVINIFVANIMNDGKAARAISQAYGIKRVGY